MLNGVPYGYVAPVVVAPYAPPVVVAPRIVCPYGYYYYAPYGRLCGRPCTSATRCRDAPSVERCGNGPRRRSAARLEGFDGGCWVGRPGVSTLLYDRGRARAHLRRNRRYAPADSSGAQGPCPSNCRRIISLRVFSHSLGPFATGSNPCRYGHVRYCATGTPKSGRKFRNRHGPSRVDGAARVVISSSETGALESCATNSATMN